MATRLRLGFPSPQAAAIRLRSYSATPDLIFPDSILPRYCNVRLPGIERLLDPHSSIQIESIRTESPPSARSPDFSRLWLPQGVEIYIWRPQFRVQISAVPGTHVRSSEYKSPQFRVRLYIEAGVQEIHK
jgi:hypothetical protein